MPDVVASQVSVRDLKTHLSEWLARAQAGEVVELANGSAHSGHPSSLWKSASNWLKRLVALQMVSRSGVTTASNSLLRMSCKPRPLKL
jgi:hypothetical protein